MFKTGDKVEFLMNCGYYKQGQHVVVHGMSSDGRYVYFENGNVRAYSNRFKLVEENTMTKFYIIWNPASPLAPTTKFTSKEQADRVAKEMATKYECNQFFVLEAVGVAQRVTVDYKEIK